MNNYINENSPLLRIVNKEKNRIVQFSDLRIFELDGKEIFLEFYDGFTVSYTYNSIKYNAYSSDDDEYNILTVYSNDLWIAPVEKDEYSSWNINE